MIGTGSTGVQLSSATLAWLGCGVKSPCSAHRTMGNRGLTLITQKLARVFHRASGFADYKAYSLSFENVRDLRSAIRLPAGRGRVAPAYVGCVTDCVGRDDYEPMCKRLVMSGGFYQRFQRDDVRWSPPVSITSRYHVTDDGVLHGWTSSCLPRRFDSHAFFPTRAVTGRDDIRMAKRCKTVTYNQTVTYLDFRTSL